MTSDYHQHVINELQKVIDDTQATLTRFEEAGMDKEMPEDYEKLMDILDGAVKQQREHTKAMLGWLTPATCRGDAPDSSFPHALSGNPW